VKPIDLLTTAEILIDDDSHRSLDANLRRAVSSMYYAMFHTLAEDAANLLVESIHTASTKSAWRQAYRALEHRRVKEIVSGKRADRDIFGKFPLKTQEFANFMSILQEERNLADYDPFHMFDKPVVQEQLEKLKNTIDGYKQAECRHRRAFCVFVLVKSRG